MATQQAEAHQRSQDALAAALVAALMGAWDLLDPKRLSATFPAFAAAAYAVVRQYSIASATLSATDYRTARAAAGIPGRHTVTPARVVSQEQFTRELQYATRALWSAQVLAPSEALTGTVVYHPQDG